MPIRQARPIAPAEPTPAEPQDRSRYVPAVLDAIIPGVGHLVAGRRRRAVLFLAPMLIALAAAIFIAVTTSPARLAASLVESEVLWTLLAFEGLLLVWRLLAVSSSLTAPGLPRLGRRDAIPVAILLLVIIAPQVYAGYGTEVARETADAIFVDEPAPVAAGPSVAPEPDPSFLEPAEPSASPSAGASASPSPSAPVVERINALVVGVDAGVGRNTYATDTMIVVSLDPVNEVVSMVSIPRDMVDVPLADGRKFSAKINGLVAYARHHPKQFPGSDGTGFDVLRGALGKLLGLDIPYYAAVNLGGFVAVVNTLGGVNVNVEHAFCDPHYSEYGYEHGFAITAGRHHLTGTQALAYARIRKASGESDFTRAARQQEVLSGLRDTIERGGFMNDPIGLLKAIGKTVSTNIPRKRLPDLAEAAAKVGRGDTYRAVITHPLVKSGFDRRGSVQLPVMKRITALAEDLFPTDGSLPKKRYKAPKASTQHPTSGGVSGCGAQPTKKPTPKPTKKPTPKPTATPVATPPEPTPTPVPAATPTPSVATPPEPAP